jgi:membrane protein YqaA with SNARE-associated domain
MPLYVLLTVAGSVAGCLVMHAIGRKGGDALVRKRFAGARVERAKASLQRHGLMAVLIPSLLPPPAPFKLFVLMAGLAEVRPLPFVLSIAVARGLRYLVLGALAIRYGDAALELMRTRGRVIALWVVVILVAAAVGWWLFKRSSRARS